MIFISTTLNFVLSSLIFVLNICKPRTFTFRTCTIVFDVHSFRPHVPKIADFRQKIGDFYVFTITYSLFTKSKGRFLKVRGNSEYVFLGYDHILTHPYGHNEPTEADL